MGESRDKRVAMRGRTCRARTHARTHAHAQDTSTAEHSRARPAKRTVIRHAPPEALVRLRAAVEGRMPRVAAQTRDFLRALAHARLRVSPGAHHPRKLRSLLRARTQPASSMCPREGRAGRFRRSRVKPYLSADLTLRPSSATILRGTNAGVRREGGGGALVPALTRRTLRARAAACRRAPGSRHAARPRIWRARRVRAHAGYAHPDRARPRTAARAARARPARRRSRLSPARTRPKGRRHPAPRAAGATRLRVEA